MDKSTEMLVIGMVCLILYFVFSSISRKVMADEKAKLLQSESAISGLKLGFSVDLRLHEAQDLSEKEIGWVLRFYKNDEEIEGGVFLVGDMEELKDAFQRAQDRGNQWIEEQMAGFGAK